MTSTPCGWGAVAGSVSSSSKRRSFMPSGSHAAVRGIGRARPAGQEGEGGDGAQIGEGRERLREGIEQVVAQPIEQAALVAAGSLVLPRQRAERLYLRARRLERTVTIPVGAQDPREQFGVSGIALGAGGPRAPAVALNGLGVEGI